MAHLPISADRPRAAVRYLGRAGARITADDVMLIADAPPGWGREPTLPTLLLPSLYME